VHLLLIPLVALGGCTDEADGEVTWSEDVAPIVTEHCASCHTEGNIAPFALDEYETASAMASAMLAAVEDGSMPPWLARETDECAPPLPYQDDLRLSEAEVQTLRDWVDAGAPEGDPEDAAALPAAPALVVQAPDRTLRSATPYKVEGTSDDFPCVVFDPELTEKVWVTEMQLTPSNDLVAHHGLVYHDIYGDSLQYVDEDNTFPCFAPPDIAGALMMTWTPGMSPMVTPEGAGMHLGPDSLIVVQMHYHPTGTTVEEDSLTLDLKYTTEQPELEALQALVGNYGSYDEETGLGLQPGMNDEGGVEFRIPADTSGHIEEMIYTQEVPIEFPIFSVGTHMHYVGTDMKIDLIREDGQEDCLVQTPRWDFNWQRTYTFDAPIDELPTIDMGESLRMRCTYDNTLDNPSVRAALSERGLDATSDVYLGEETLDEMCLGLFGILVPSSLIDQLY
jgi:hypothetical protein